MGNVMENKTNQKILIFGGAFNPPHIGHLHILENAIDYIHPDKILILVDKVSPWKHLASLLPYTYRYTMVHNLFCKNLNCEIYENKNNLVYSSDIIQEIHHNNLDAQLFFLVGQDQYKVIETWNNYDIINRLTTIVCYKRGDEPITRLFDKHIILSGIKYPYSSSKIRLQPDAAIMGAENYNYVITHNLFLLNRIKPYMSDRRYEHTTRVLDTITKIAIGNKFSDEELLQAQNAALLHDIAKQLTDEQLHLLLTEDEIKSFPTPHCAHGLAGMRLAIKDFRINDPIILDAIEAHVIFTEKAKNNKIAKALFLADKLEPARTKADIENREQLLSQAIVDLEQTFPIVLKQNTEKY